MFITDIIILCTFCFFNQKPVIFSYSVIFSQITKLLIFKNLIHVQKLGLKTRLYKVNYIRSAIFIKLNFSFHFNKYLCLRF